MTDHPDQPAHGTAIAIDGVGILIRGTPGSGKTTLALELIRRARGANHPGALIADDRVFIDAEGPGPVLRCPPQILGKLEVRGYGIVTVDDALADQTPLGLIVDLVPASEAVRFAEDETEMISATKVPRLKLPAGPAPSAANAVMAALGLPIGS